MFFRAASRRVPTSAAVRGYSRSVKSRGGDAHHSHSHAPAGPYDVPHHPTYPNEAYLFGINPNVPRKSEGWELITFATYIIGGAIMIAGANVQPLNTFKLWAKQEAITREQIVANGGVVEYGTFVTKESSLFAEGDSVGSMPVLTLE